MNSILQGTGESDLMTLSATWAVVVAAVVGGMAGIGGSFVQRRWEARSLATQNLHDLCVKVASATLMLIFDIGWYADRDARRFLRWRRKCAVGLLRQPLREAAWEIAHAKSELDLLVTDEELHSATDSLLAACRDYSALVMDVAQPEEQTVANAVDALGEARKAFLRVAAPYLARQRRTWLGRFLVS